MEAEDGEKKVIPSSRILGLSLVDVALAFNPAHEENDELELNYHVEITTPSVDGDDVYFFSAEVMISKGVSGSDELTAIRATYICGIKCRNMEYDRVLANARRYAQTSIWSSFVSLAAVVSNQMRAQFPVLPPMAARVSIKAETDEAPSTAGDDTE